MTPITALPPAGLLNRRAEREMLDQMVAGARAGQSRVLVLRGEAGVGKTALLRHLSAAAAECRVARAAGVESEMELAFAGVHALCAPVLARLPHLPAPAAASRGPPASRPRWSSRSRGSITSARPCSKARARCRRPSGRHYGSPSAS